MSDLLNQASLVLIPSGYKEDVVYSAIPTNGNGDLSFTRASNGTRVNSAGLVEVVPWNLLQQSETFNTTWGASNTVVTANQTTAPNGTTTADLIVDNASNTSHSLTQGVTNLSVGLDYYYFIYVKNNNHTWVALRHDNGGTFNFFNIATGVKGTNAQANSTIENVGNGWYKLTVPFTVASSSSGPEFYLASADGTYSYAGTGTGVYIWGASYTLSAKPYFPTTDRLNVPRLTYQNGGGGCPSLLLEKQSTNLCLYSEQFDNASWAKINANGGSAPIVTANYGISPDGTQNAERIQLARTTTNGSYSYVYQSLSVVSSTVYTWSVWLKSLSGTPTITIAYSGSSYNNTVTLTTEWARYDLQITTVGNNVDANFLLYEQVPATSLSADFLAWGFQVEQSLYETSYIPTTSSSATRVADACFKTGISSLIGQSEGSIFLDFVVNGQSNAGNAINIYNNDYTATTTSTIAITYDQGTISCFAFRGNGTYDNISVTGSGYSIGQRLKVAYRYKSGDFALYVNGVQKDTDTSTLTFNGTKLEIYLNALNVYYAYPDAVQYNEFVQFPTALTNAELQAISTI